MADTHDTAEHEQRATPQGERAVERIFSIIMPRMREPGFLQKMAADPHGAILEATGINLREFDPTKPLPPLPGT